MDGISLQMLGRVNRAGRMSLVGRERKRLLQLLFLIGVLKRLSLTSSLTKRTTKGYRNLTENYFGTLSKEYRKRNLIATNYIFQKLIKTHLPKYINVSKWVLTFFKNIYRDHHICRDFFFDQ